MTSPSSSVDSFRAFKEATSFDQAEFIEGDPAVVERLATTLDELESRTQDIPIEVDRTQSRRTELMDHRSSLGRDRLDAPLSVPEPSTVALVIVGAATLLSFHARNDRRQDR